MKIQVIGVTIYHSVQGKCALHFIMNGREHFPQCDHNIVQHILEHASRLGIKFLSDVTPAKTAIKFDLDESELFIDYEKEFEQASSELNSLREQYQALLDALDWIVKPQGPLTVDQKIKKAHVFRKGYENLKSKLVDMGFKNPKEAAAHIESLETDLEIANKRIAYLSNQERKAAARREKRQEQSKLRQHIKIQDDELNKMRALFQEHRADMSELYTIANRQISRMFSHDVNKVVAIREKYGFPKEF
jgi:hypothetical protein